MEEQRGRSWGRGKGPEVGPASSAFADNSKEAPPGGALA